MTSRNGARGVLCAGASSRRPRRWIAGSASTTVPIGSLVILALLGAVSTLAFSTIALSQRVPPRATPSPTQQPFAEAFVLGASRSIFGSALSAAAAIAGGLGVCGAIVSGSSRRPVGTRLCAWGDDVSFYGATVKENVEAADGFRLISMDVPTEVSQPFSKAGQYVQAKGADDVKASFYAISSPPSKSGGALEFLIKESESNAWLTGARAGEAVKMSAAMGKGYNVEGDSWAGNVNQVNLFATGSGIAPIRSVIESGVLDGKACRLYYGARTDTSMAYTDRFSVWRQRGVEVVPVFSKSTNSGRSGYVQQAFQEDEERGEGFVLAASHGSILCGQKEMVEAVREIYKSLSVAEDRSLLNF